MNAGQLLAHFDRISEAPEAVARLRRFILDLAVRGKLVEQDSNDEPASGLLGRIAELTGQSFDIENQRDDHVPFELPQGWKWSRLGAITTKTGSGSTPRGGQSVYQACGVPFLRSQNVHNDGLRLNDVAYIDDITHAKMHGTAVEPGDLLLNITGGSIGRCCRVPDTPIQANISQHVAIIRLAVTGMRDFVHKVVLSSFFQSFVIDEQTGAGRGGLPKNRMDRIPIPVPPIEEQNRIVGKVDKLMALCDRLEAAQADRESRRDRLVAASLHRLNNGADAGAFREHAHFHLRHLSRLTTRPEHIQQIRQTIFNLAVRGLLVPQDPSDEPASILGMSSPRGSRGRGAQDSPGDDAWPNEIPRSWKWQRLGSISAQVTDGEHATPPRIHEQQVPLVTAKNVRDGFMDYSDTDWVSFETASKAWGRCRPTVGDILLVCVGATTGRLCVLREARDMVLVRSVALMRPTSAINVDYFALALRSPMCQVQIWGKVKMTAQPCLYINRINSLPIPLPPLAEQIRIVTKVEELLALCDRLEAQIDNTATNSRQLLEATLHAFPLKVHGHALEVKG